MRRRGHRHRFHRSGLLARVFVHGLVLVVASAVGFCVIAMSIVGPAKERQMRVLTGWVGQYACQRVAASPEPAKAVETVPVMVGVFTAEGQLLAGSTLAPLGALAPDDLVKLRDEGECRRGLARVLRVPCADGTGRYAVVGGPLSPLSRGDVAWSILGVVLVVLLGSLPLVGSLMRPLRELSLAADKLGRGDLGARVRVRRDDELGDLARSFNRMAENLSTHLLAEKELLANVSHELRTPLARVRVVMEMAKESPERTEALLEEVAKDLADLERLTDDVLATIRLDFASASAESIRIRARPERVDLVALVQRSIARCVETYAEREVELEAPDDIAPVQGDPALLTRLVDNLLENARRYSSGTVQVRLASQDGGVTIEVEDHGIGIDPADLPKVFEPFFRSDRSRARANGGTGLGLTLCRRVVEVHRGRIAVRSEPLVGTTVEVWLPR